MERETKIKVGGGDQQVERERKILEFVRLDGMVRGVRRR